jgi:hypothetical protein
MLHKQQKDTDKEPMLNVGEKILWKNVIKRGFWHRHVEWVLEITTQGIIMEDGVNGHITRLPYLLEHRAGHVGAKQF